jgi:hypothetical protein
VTLEENLAWARQCMETHRLLSKYDIDPQQYSCLSEEEFVAKVKEDTAAAKRAKRRVPPPGEDPTDELWAVPDKIRAEIEVWKREAGLPEKYSRIHDCVGRSVDHPEEGCDFVRFADNIYVCKATGIVHVCVGEPCSRATPVADNDLVCTISAVSFPYIYDSVPPYKHDIVPPDLLFPKEEEESGWPEEEETGQEEEEEEETGQEEEDDDDDNFKSGGAEAESEDSTSSCSIPPEDWIPLEEKDGEGRGILFQGDIGRMRRNLTAARHGTKKFE